MSIKESNSFNDQNQIFVKKYLLVQTPREKYWQSIFDLLKFINKVTTVINILF